MLRPVSRVFALVPASMAALMTLGCDEQGTLPGATDDTRVESDATAATETTITSEPDGTTAPIDSTTPPTDTGATTSPPADTTVSDGGISLPTERPPIVASHTTFVGDWNMNPARETTRCVVKRLDNADTLWVSQIRAKLAKGSHHMIVYKSAETEERTTPFECDPFVETLSGETFPIMITQTREETLAFPNGVAFKFEPHQMVRIEAHFYNYYTEPITAHGEVFFDGIAAEKVVAEANMLFYGTPDITIPKQSSVTTPWYFLDVMAGTHLFAVTGHTHAYGTNVEIGYSDKVDDVGTSIYPPEDEPFDWQEPPVAHFDPHLFFGDGGKKGLRYRCSWTNDTNDEVGFGESATAEMCFLWGYYYPSKGYRMCISPGGLAGGIFGEQVCCGGEDESPVCDLVRNWAGGN